MWNAEAPNSALLITSGGKRLDRKGITLKWFTISMLL